MAVRVSSTNNRVLLKDPNGPVSIGSTNQRALLRDADGPVNIANAVQRVLIITEAPPADTNVYSPYVVEQVLIKENGSPSKVTGVSWSVLIEELPGSAYVPSLWQLSLAQTEAPVVEERVSQVIHLALTADLERGVQLVSYTLSQAVVRTEPLSRDPERYKVVAHSTAHSRAVVNPVDIQSDSRSKQMMKLAAQSVSPLDPIYVRSYKLRQTTWSSVVVQTPATKPEEVRDRKRIQIIGVETTHSTTPRSPLDFRQWAPTPSVVVMSANVTPYANGTDVHSEKHVNVVQTMSAAPSANYPILPKSEKHVNAYKCEIAQVYTEYLDPSDIRLKPVVAVQQVAHTTAHEKSATDPQFFRSDELVHNYKVETAHLTTGEDPSLIRSTPVTAGMMTEVVSETEYDPPQGIYPSVRLNQTRALVAAESPDYGQFPRSLENLRILKNDIAHKAVFKNPGDIKNADYMYQVLIQTATLATIYGEPERVKPKRRTSSAQVTKR